MHEGKRRLPALKFHAADVPRVRVGKCFTEHRRGRELIASEEPVKSIPRWRPVVGWELEKRWEARDLARLCERRA